MSDEVRKIRFKKENPRNLIISTASNSAEIFDFSLINEAMTQRFSLKGVKNLTEITDFSFSENRSRDWASLMTIHKKTNFPYLWNMEDKSLTKVSLEMNFENSSKITSGKVTNCGNFALIGFSNGQVIKFNMQSGK